ncbi:phospholipase D-like domain-containing protein [Varunaivibrio sulfuroxidans]|uniref:Phospholipase D n=1 Tax=Varunaivibrio sulfuroxidans TaxID=1773489 RepID=A0A4R3JCU5_9PROT|nr:phospholipase D-like domain-containing protein [Varunaivibrio sulfuroxidans]TCS62963.1 phosphatidylserine/phosphatidylglycerophosphate/cardiolipin synthase-like enzyme [Varunaivibrio sulfuroxidans]WES31959.1 phospholipase D-like domain-containing protein [Varunaivibrio sulfuroxidans]
MVQVLGNIEIYMGPRDLGGDDLEAVLVGFIDAARKTLDVAVQELESVPIAHAFARARRRGVRVRMVLEGDYLTTTKAPADPFLPGAMNEANRELFMALLRARCDVRTDYNPKIFHQKFIARDYGYRTRAVLTGSTNFTPTGLHANLNHIVIVRSARVAAQYVAEFAEIWGGTFGDKRLRHDPRPSEISVSGVRVKPLFAPDHAPEMEIMKQMLKAKRRIDFAIFTFSRSSGIDDAMMVLVRSGIVVRGIFDHGQGVQKWAATQPLARAGAELYTAPRGHGLNKLHHKLMVIDGALIIAGSFNYTGPANLLNDENILVIGDLEEADPQAQADQKILGQAVEDEISRIIQTFGRPV